MPVCRIRQVICIPVPEEERVARLQAAARRTARLLLAKDPSGDLPATRLAERDDPGSLPAGAVLVPAIPLIPIRQRSRKKKSTGSP